MAVFSFFDSIKIKFLILFFKIFDEFYVYASLKNIFNKLKKSLRILRSKIQQSSNFHKVIQTYFTPIQKLLITK